MGIFKNIFGVQSGKMGEDLEIIQCWKEKRGTFFIWVIFRQRYFRSFSKLATPDQSRKNKKVILQPIIKGDIGLSSTSFRVAKRGSIPQEPVGPWKFQWEYPNCWPPLMMIAVEGLKNYGFVKGGKGIWAKLGNFCWEENLIGLKRICGKVPPHSTQTKVEQGYYGNMKGFGWTIATYLCFRAERPVRSLVLTRMLWWRMELKLKILKYLKYLKILRSIFLIISTHPQYKAPSITKSYVIPCSDTLESI